MTGHHQGHGGIPLLPERYGDGERIGVGGMGEVYRAFDRSLQRRVAVKFLAPALAEDEQARRRFTREALAAARLSGHPNVVTIYDVGEWGGRPYLVMEYAAGGTLAERARSGPVPQDLALRWLAQAAAALDEAHRAGLVHRDVKPANLLFDEREQLKVADFGIVRVSDASGSGITGTNALVGSVGYMAPEQLRGEPAGPEADVYALGVVAYELLTGGRPFGKRTTAAEMNAHLTEPPPPASERGVGLPRRVDPVFARALAKEPAARPASAGALVADLADALRPPAPPPEPAPAPVPDDAPTRVQHRPAPAVAAARPTAPAVRRSHRPLLLGGLVALALAGGTVAAVMAMGDDETRPGAGTSGETVARVVTRVETVSTPAEVRTVTTTAPAPAPEPQPEPEPAAGDGAASASVPVAEARRLTDDAYRRILAGDPAGALPLAERALAGLEGTGDAYEGNALNNMGVILTQLDRCSDAVPYLERAQGTGSAAQNAERVANLARAEACASGTAAPARADATDGPAPSVPQARADTDTAYGLIEGGREEEGLARQLPALRALEAAGDPYAGNAAYNVGYALIRLGRCGAAVPYLERSQGSGSASQNAIRRDALAEARACR